MTTRRKRNLLDSVLSASSTPMCILDSDRRIRFFSPGLEQQTGWSASDLEGLICRPAATADATVVELMTSAMTPSAEVYSGELQSLDAVLPRRDGSAARVRLTHLPFKDSDDQVSRVAVISELQPSSPPSGASVSQRLHAEITALRIEFRRRFSDQSFIGSSPMIRRALDQAELLKDSGCGYSIVGPSGSGRRHLAKLIHVAGQQSESSLVALDCQLLTGEQVLETLRRIRRIAAEDETTPHATTGTLLLVDADRCPREVQHWLLQNLVDEAENVRIVATSEQSLEVAESDGWMSAEFRDLFRTLELVLPTLHEREDDVTLLTQHFIDEARHSLNTSAESISKEAMEKVLFYRWPGNVRELQNVITDACQNSFATELTEEDLPFEFAAGVEAQKMPVLPKVKVQSLESLLVQFEVEVLKNTLDSCSGNKAEAARRLGMTRPRLYRRLKTLGLEGDDSD